MDPRKVKLSIRQSIRPIFNATKESEFVIFSVVLIFLFTWNCFVATMFPKVLSVPFFDAVFSFMCSLLFNIATIGLLAFACEVWSNGADSESGKDLYEKYKRSLDEELTKKKKEILDNIIDDEVLK